MKTMKELKEVVGADNLEQIYEVIQAAPERPIAAIFVADNMMPEGVDPTALYMGIAVGLYNMAKRDSMSEKGRELLETTAKKFEEKTYRS